MEKIKFNAQLWRLSRDREDETTLVLKAPSSELDKVIQIPANKLLLVEVGVEE